MDHSTNKTKEKWLKIYGSKEEHQIIASKRDREVFFNVLMGNENPPNEALLSAIKYYDKENHQPS